MSYPQPLGRSPGFALRQWSATWWLIAINIAAYVLDLASRHRLSMWGAFTVVDAIYHFQVWRFLTFQFLHGNAFHILINMIVLYFFGPMAEGPLGKKRFVLFYLLCGLAGAVSFVVFWSLGFLNVVEFTPLVGASAGIFGVMVGAVRLEPKRTVRLLVLYVFPVTMTLRMMVIILLAIAVAMIMDAGSNAGGEAAHLGGAAMGFVLMSLWIRKAARRAGGHRFWRPGDDNFLRDEFRQ